ncbi:hypothetical protein [Providencia sneebia]|uniref:Uncharacterized protein n=1 Tax=Providencia sneebia DSM 19967 TaxID=1141660 RepID=K8W6T6_9GAMM|nr:hypothetical protein OO7_11374 [Providencia sneebia DSM 19967]
MSDKLIDIITDILSDFKWRTSLMIIMTAIVLISGFNRYLIVGFILLSLILYSPEIWRYMNKKRTLK